MLEYAEKVIGKVLEHYHQQIDKVIVLTSIRKDLLDNATQEIDDLKKQNKDLSERLDEANAIIDAQSKALDQLYGEKL